MVSLKQLDSGFQLRELGIVGDLLLRNCTFCRVYRVAQDRERLRGENPG